MLYDFVSEFDQQLSIQSHRNICAFLECCHSWETSEINRWGRDEDKTLEDTLWRYLCELISASKEVKSPVFLYTNTLECKEWRDLLEACPYARPVVTTKSQMGNYSVTCWIIDVNNFKDEE